MIIWGQSVYPLHVVEKSENAFAEKYNVAVLTDKMSNCHANNAIINTTVTMSIMKGNQAPALQPDIVITVGANYIFNNEIKAYLKNGTSEHWQVGKEDKVCDPFHTLTDIFEMPESHFFDMLVENCFDKTENDYYLGWKEISDLPTLPDMQYCELYAITRLMSQLPSNCDLQLANSQTIRMAHYIPIKEGIRVNCNRGVNGIDGSMSTAVGFGANSNRPLFYITGELSFFYDMNCLSIRHLSKKTRILLINNSGGAVMYDQPRNTSTDNLPIYLAAGETKVAKGWAESLGFKYLPAHNKEEVDAGVKVLLDESIDTPVILEVFTNLSEDRYCIVDYIKSQDRRSFSEKVGVRISRMFKK